MGKKKAIDIAIEAIQSEQEDAESSPSSYEIIPYPADFTLEVLVKKLKDGDIIIPSLQRKFVWKQPQASRLIESFLLGLPVPPIFLFESSEEPSLLVIDGQQRLKSVAYFFDGKFGEEEGGKLSVFHLTKLHEDSPYLNKTIDDLKRDDPDAVRRLKNAVLRSFIVKQLTPNDDTSIVHIFERLNTGGTQLVGQEIRNCLYRGPFNELLLTLNSTPAWREIVGKRNEDKRQRDVELVLRFFALLFDSKGYEKPMKDFMSGFMAKHRNPTAEARQIFQQTFEGTMCSVQKHLGPKPFHLRAGLNAAAFDATCVAFARHPERIPPTIYKRFQKMIRSAEFEKLTSAATTDKDVVFKRLRYVESQLFQSRSRATKSKAKRVVKKRPRS